MQDFTFKNSIIDLSIVRAALPASIETLRKIKPYRVHAGLVIDADINVLTGGLEFDGLELEKPYPSLGLSASKGSRGLSFHFRYNTLKLHDNGMISRTCVLFGDYSASTESVKARNTEKNLLIVWNAGLDLLPEQIEKVYTFYNIVDSSI